MMQSSATQQTAELAQIGVHHVVQGMFLYICRIHAVIERSSKVHYDRLLQLRCCNSRSNRASANATFVVMFASGSVEVDGLSLSSPNCLTVPRKR
jgi:hypothetical protein